MPIQSTRANQEFRGLKGLSSNAVPNGGWKDEKFLSRCERKHTETPREDSVRTVLTLLKEAGDYKGYWLPKLAKRDNSIRYPDKFPQSPEY